MLLSNKDGNGDTTPRNVYYAMQNLSANYSPTSRQFALKY
ncbi:hypothetical protein T4C_7487 [Trichinella pseudospiralis]|uniref:Uncharacterized protein n=1 Tax=Trichinella pseudospiralis TaxID=6337 RepID=A0A0V1GHL8_TRIPS|nr:hypothetical protein T4C_7487 [Trichinella pseudospiralis]